MGLNAIRAWAFFDVPDLVGSVWFQAWSAEQNQPVINTGPNGLERLDRAIALAEEHGIRLILPFVNYWDDYGGVNQYVRWFGLRRQGDFYADARAREAYKAYVRRLLTRVNTLTGRAYRDEPAVLAWELANEPRSPRASKLLVNWAEEMSRYIKGIDSNHLVACGDEGFFRKWWRLRNSAHNGAHGVDTEALLRLPAIDFGTYHLYAGDRQRADAVAFGRRWIRDHVQMGAQLGKPVLLEEYGIRETQPGPRNEVYAGWLSAVREYGGAGDLVWAIAGDMDGSKYPDYDGFTLYSAADAAAIVDQGRRLS